MSDIKADDIQLETSAGMQRGSAAEDQSGDDALSYHDTEYRVSTRTYVVLVTMAIAWGTCTMANIGPSTTYSYAVEVLGGASIATWIPNASLFPIIALQPIWGSLADRFGKKWFIVAGGVAGVVGNAIAGTANKTEVIIAGQALNGLGSSLYLLVVPAGMEIVPAKQRSFAQGFMGSINGLMSVMVLLVSGAFAKMSTSSGWRWVYHLNDIFFGVVAILTILFYNPPPTKLLRESIHTNRSILKSIDFVGVILFICGMICLVIPLVWGGNAYPWNNARIIALLVVGGAFLVAFGFYDAYGRPDGLLDHRFFAQRNYPLVLAVAFVDGMILYGVNAFLPQQVGGLFTQDPVTVSVYLLPLNLGVIVGITSSTWVLGVFRHYRLILVSAILLITTFCGLLALVDSTRHAMLLGFTCVIGIGVGVTTAIPNVILTYAVPSHLIGTAGTLLASCRGLGGTVGITIFAAINGNYTASHKIQDITQAVVKAGLSATSAQEFVTAFLAGDTSALAGIAGATPSVITAAQQALKDVTAGSFKFVWIANAIIGLITAGLACFLLPIGDKMTSHVEAPLEEGKSRESAMVKTIE
ncbi:hypothetical protein SEUCBS140593_009878 [Sporothrix eucalyptigena]|uniref:Major facilitator superfamily (MFS) profile domain-containing protein n=1 Tax=Sporothrix eucalyptigena TaxID=1812306 RepID=A0ABP0D274_9PEZI